MKITQNDCDCKILFQPNFEYVDVTTLYDPSYDESATLSLVYKIDSNGQEQLLDMSASIHIDSEGQYDSDSFTLTSPSDGWYKVVTYFFPTKTSLENLGMIDNFKEQDYQHDWSHMNRSNMLRNDTTMILAGSPEGFWFLGRQNVANTPAILYKWLEVTDINDLIDELTTRGIENDYVYGTNIKAVVNDYFSYCNLYKCFIKKAEALLDSYKGCGGTNRLCSKSTDDVKCKSTISDYDVQIRDYLWMVITAIKYAIECEDYRKANKLLSCITTCNGICDEVKQTSTGCGCS